MDASHGMRLRGHLPTLDGLRGVAILVVLAFHYYTFDHHLAPFHWLFSLARSGWLGVDLFFVLSGFLITGILLDTKDREEPGFFKTFYIRRTLRIMPLYYAVLVLVFGILRWTPAFAEPTFQRLAREDAWALFLYAVNWVNFARGELVFVSDSFEANHFWSLAIEEQFYLVWPATVWWLPKRTFAAVSALVVLASFVAKAWLAPPETTLMLFRADGLVLGALLAVLARLEETRGFVVPVAKWLFAGSVVWLLAVFVLHGGLLHEDPTMARFGCSVVAVASAAAIALALAVREGTRMDRVLRAPSLALLGKYSYGIYVLHWAFNPLYERYTYTVLPEAPTGIGIVDALLRTALKVVFAVLAAMISFRWFEQPFLALKDRWAPTRRAPQGDG